MKRIANSSVIFRMTVASLLSLAFVATPAFRTAAAKNVAPAAAKTEAQLRDEASRYEKAMLAISNISSSKLDTPEALRQALELFKQQRTNIRFHLSKLIVKALSDSTFSAAVKKTANNLTAGEKLLKDLNADRTAVLRLDGAKALVPVLDDARRKDAEFLRKAGEALRAAGEKAQKSGFENADYRSTTNEFQMVQAKFWIADRPTNDFNTLMPAAEPGTIVLAIAVAAAVVVASVFIATAIANLYNNLFTEAGRDAVIECQKQADERLEVCLTSAGRLDFLSKLAAEAICGGQWMIDQSQCLVKA